MFCQEFIKPSGIHESLFVGYLWKNPKLYKKYKNNDITQPNKETNEGMFTQKTWYFYYKLGLQMFSSGIQNFNDISVMAFISSQPDIGDFSWSKVYNGYGGYKTMYQIMQECDGEENEAYHFSEIQKMELLRYYENQGLLSPDKIIIKKKKEVIMKNFLMDLSLEKIKSYFSYHTKKGSQSVGTSNITVTNLTEGVRDSVRKFNEGSTMGLSLYDSPRLTRIIKGWQLGNFLFLVLSSGAGKSSLTHSKFTLAILDSDEKCVFGVNEENKDRAHHTLLSTVSSTVTNDPITRDRLSEGCFTKEEYAQIEKATVWLESHQEDKVKFAEIQKFYLEDYLELLELNKSLGYNYAVLDTFKPDQSKTEMARWEKFSQHSQDIFDCVKPTANNIGMLATLQLKIGMETRYLDLDCIGKAKEPVEVADIVLMGRLLFEDEYEKLKVYDYVLDDDGEGYHRKDMMLDEDKEYLILFIPKNRNGSKTQQVVYEIDYDTNHWKEIGYANVRKSAK